MLGFTTVSIGIGEGLYNFGSDFKRLSPLDKVKYIKAIGDEKSKEIVEELVAGYKGLIKIPRKSSKEIVLIKQSESIINKIFALETEEYLERLDDAYGIEIMNDFFNSDSFLSYITTEEYRFKADQLLIPDTAILQLQIPKEEGLPLLFLNISTNVDTLYYTNIKDKEAESLSKFYGSELINFPNLSIITSNQIALVRDDLKNASEVFRAKLNEWMTLCYDNPNSNLGLEYFRKNLLPLKESADDLARQSPTLNGFSEFTNSNGGVAILFGEAPIEMIWKIYLDTETISQEIFDKLLEIKIEQAPKFDGRWPVAFIKAIKEEEVLEEENEDTNSETAIKSVRKSISLD